MLGSLVGVLDFTYTLGVVFYNNRDLAKFRRPLYDSPSL